MGQHLEAAFLKTQALQEVLGFLVAQLGDLGLYLGADGDGGLAVDGSRGLAHLVLVDVGHIDHRLHGEQEELLGGGALLGRHAHGGGTLAVVEPGLKALSHGQLGSQLLVAPGLLLQLGQLLFQGGDVCQDELGHDGVGVGRRVDTAIHMDDIRVGEVAHHLADGVSLADVGQELVAQAFAGIGALDQAGDVYELHRGRHDALRGDDGSQLAQPSIWHVHDAHIGLDSGEGIVGGQAGALGEGGKERGLAHVGQTYDADGESHSEGPFLSFMLALLYPLRERQVP